MTQLLSLFNQVFGNQSKSEDTEQSSQNHISGIQKSLKDLIEAWLEARSEQAKHYQTHSHIE